MFYQAGVLTPKKTHQVLSNLFIYIKSCRFTNKKTTFKILAEIACCDVIFGSNGGFYRQD